MFEQILNGEDLRMIINNAHLIKANHQCSRCNTTGYTNWNGETGDDERPGRLVNYDSIRIDGECEDCEGIGYKNVFMFS